MSDISQLTIGDVLPKSMHSNYSAKILSTPLSEARDIVKFGKPSKSGLSLEDIKGLESIYKEYRTKPASPSKSSFWSKDSSDSQSSFWSKSDTEGQGSFWSKKPQENDGQDAYWNKSEADNDAYWNKNS